MVITSIALNSEAFSWNWQLLSINFTDTLPIFCWIRWFIIDSTKRSEQTSDKQSPNVMAIPLSGLIQVLKFFISFRENQKYIGIYCGKRYSGLIMDSPFVFRIDMISPFNSKISWPRQYCVLYRWPSRLMFKHWENPPNSYKLPLKMNKLAKYTNVSMKVQVLLPLIIPKYGWWKFSPTVHNWNIENDLL